MKILITGAGGFIGKHLCQHFSKDHEIIALMRSDAAVTSSRTIHLDLTDTALVQLHIANKNIPAEIDCIIHCASILATPETSKDFGLFQRNNAITESLMHIAEFAKPTMLINFSSIGVYPNADGTYTETSHVAPSVNSECLYSLAKLCSEELFSFYLGKQLRVVNIRLSQTYGKGMREDRIYSIMLKELKEHNTITVYGNGERESNFISIEYLLSTMEKIISHPTISGTFNLGEHNISYRTLAEMIAREQGDKGTNILFKPQGVRSKAVIDSTKLLKTLNIL